MKDYVSVYFVAPTMAEAEAIASTLVADRLAACVNILPGVRSIYRWQGKIETGTEVALIAKSRQSLFAQLEAKVKSLTSYECPCIVAWPIAEGHQPYLNWIQDETAG